MPIVSGLDIHRKQITFDYLCDMRPLVVSERVRGGQRCWRRDSGQCRGPSPPWHAPLGPAQRGV